MENRFKTDSSTSEDNYADLDIVGFGSYFANDGFVLTLEKKTPNIN